ncbi:MAG: hypothetical protein AAGI48_10720 [Verrucomicrobiota bacterium]
MRNLITVAIALLSVALAVASGAESGGNTREELMSVALDGADRLIVESVPQPLDSDSSVDKHEIRGREKIARLVEGLSFDEELSGRVCVGFGDWQITFKKEGKVAEKFTLYHGDGLGWNGWEEKNNSIFTPKSAAHWRQWFRENGFNQFHEQHEAELKQKVEEERLQQAFLRHFPESVRRLFTERTADMYEGEDWIIMKEEVRDQLLNDLRRSFDGEDELARALCGAFGELNGSEYGSWTHSCHYMFLGQWAGKSLDPVIFANVIGDLHEPEELLGAARLFFQEGLGQQLNRADRDRLTARLGEVALRHDESGNAAYAFRVMSGVVSPDIDALMQEVASGRLIVESDSLSLLWDDPEPRIAACLILALHGQAGIKDLAHRLLEDAKAGSADEAALKLALYQLGDHTQWPEGIFEIWSGFLGESGLAVLAKDGSKESLDRIIREATGHPHASVREQAVLVVERLTGKRWLQGHKHERAEWHAEEIRDWWANAKKDWTDPVPDPKLEGKKSTEAEMERCSQ